MLWIYFVTASSFGQSPEEILKESKVLEDMPAYKADFEIVLPSIVGKGRIHGVLYGELTPDRSVRQRREMVTEAGGVKAQITMIIADGKMYQIFPGQQSVMEVPATTDMDQAGFARYLNDSGNFTMTMRSDKLDGRNCYVLVMTFLEPVIKQQQEAAKSLAANIPTVASQERWIDAQNFIVCKISSFDKEGHLVSQTGYSHVQTNIDLPAGLFVVPTNLTIICATNNNHLIKEIVKQTVETLPNQATRSHAGQSPEEILLRKSIALESLPCYKAEFELVLPSVLAKAKTYGVLYGKLKPNNSVCQRREMVTDVRGVKIQVNMIIADGKMYQMHPGQQGVIEMPATVDMEQQIDLGGFLSDPSNFKLEMRSQNEQNRSFNVLVVTYLEPVLKMQQEAGQQVSMLLNTHTKVPIVASQERWVDAESDIVSQISNYDRERHLISGVKYSNIQTNVDLPESLFEIPTNLTIVSVTNNTQLIKEVVKQTVRTMLNQTSEESQNALQIQTKGRYVFLGAVILQGMGVVVWIIIKYKRKQPLK